MPTAERKRELVRLIYIRDGRQCWYCGKHLLTFPLPFITGAEGMSLPHNYPTLDHIHPQSRGGRWKLDNLRVACPACNSRKSDGPALAQYVRDLVPHDTTECPRCKHLDGAKKADCYVCGGVGEFDALGAVTKLSETLDQLGSAVNSNARLAGENRRLRRLVGDVCGGGEGMARPEHKIRHSLAIAHGRVKMLGNLATGYLNLIKCPPGSVYDAAQHAVKRQSDGVPDWLVNVAVNAALSEMLCHKEAYAEEARTARATRITRRQRKRIRAAEYALITDTRGAE